MTHLDGFFKSEENQKRYGFQYRQEDGGGHSILFDGDIDMLMDKAYEAAGFVPVEIDRPNDDVRPLVSLSIDENDKLVNDETGEPIEFGVDGIGDEPNFYLRFVIDEKTEEIRFNMCAPALYPDDDSCKFRFSMASLTAINDFFEKNALNSLKEWNSLRPDLTQSLVHYPNYRAINRIR